MMTFSSRIILSLFVDGITGITNIFVTWRCVIEIDIYGYERQTKKKMTALLYLRCQKERSEMMIISQNVVKFGV